MKVYTVKKLSSTGFLLSTGWMSCDKFKVLSKPIFFNLKEGDVIDNIKTKVAKDGKAYVIDFTVLSDKGGEANHLSNTHSSTVTSSLPSSHSLGTSILEREGIKHLNPLVESSKTPSVQDRIMYAQCVNIAFSKTTYYSYLDDEQFILGSFDLADKIHAEFIKRCSR